jgi:[glutamine synthetase] adenylyltransferase / [glutamine synthetase]-adenylyl-L-tyrosine phosphorylase
MNGFRAALRRAEMLPFLADAMARHPDLVALLADGDLDQALDVARSLALDQPLRVRLRRQRRAIALAVAIGDLAGALPLEHVCVILSDFADHALDVAIGDAIAARVPGADPVGFTAIALGKHGSRELNYSSDIDPILLFDPDTLPRRERDDPAEAAVRIARHIVDLLQTRDQDGYVFRVDLRLRPASEATPLALPVNAAIGHYESSALAWERAAFIRARAAAGDCALGSRFLSAIAPFVWRRSLDFGAIDDLNALSQRIRSHYKDGQAFGPGFDLKRGRGGIREVEFYVQMQQLIHGGRDPALRAPAILDAIPALRAAGRLDDATASTLASAYRLLRTIEHRLQMVDDAQTHSLPTDASALARVAHVHGLPDATALLALLRPHIEAVGTLFDSLTGPVSRSAPRKPDQVNALLSAAGFADPQTGAMRIAAWRSGQARALRSEAALNALDAVLPNLIAAFGRAPDPHASLSAFDAVIDRLPSAINLFRLIQARPALLDTLAQIMSHAPTLAEALALQPALLDRLLDASASDPIPDVASLIATLHKTGDIQERLDRVRYAVNDHRFALGVQIVGGIADPLEVGAGYARVAEAAVVSVADAVIENFIGAYGRIPNSELVILALGRLGGGVLTHASDLDLIYLFTGTFDAESDGAKPLGATQYYNRLAQRLTGGLSAPTAAGALYEIDTRLRPSGAQGPLVVSLDSFAQYQREEAWTWEHMALARARPIYGSAGARSAVARTIFDTLKRPHDPTQVRRDAAQMRADLIRHKPAKGLFDIKMGIGGLVDLEFAVHVHQLLSGVGHHPDLALAIDALASAGLIEPALSGAYRLLTRLIITLRLVSPSLDDVAPATRPLVARTCGAEHWPQLLAQLEAARQRISEAREAAFRNGVTA